MKIDKIIDNGRDIMKYDFETIINRKGQGSAKWDLMYNTKKDVGDNIIPLSVADMEFEKAAELRDKIKELEKLM